MVSNIKTNERELAGKVAQWFNEHIARNNYAFTSASNEAGVKISKTRFADIIIWRERETNSAYSYFELKPPFVTEDLITFKEKAIQLNVKYAFTWDFQNLNIYAVDKGKIILHDTIHTPILNKIDDWLRGDKQAEIKAWIRRICDDIEKLHQVGKLERFTPEKVYFVNLIRDVVNEMIPEFERFIRDKHRKGVNKKEIDKYVYEQGITYPSDSEFYSIIARQRVYGLVTKIIFYLAVRRFFKELPDLVDTEEQDLNHALKAAFAQAANRDWQAVFLPDPIEELGIPDNAQLHLREFFKELKVYQFGELKEDVIGELFEEIIDPKERHRLGQYFTREDLVDFVIATVVNDKDGIYADPTCGSGTFLIRLYDRLKFLSGHRKTHTELLNQIWGVDIAKFPAELTTINLFRQDVSNFENFPRVINKSIFDIRNGFITEFPPPNAGLNYKTKIKIPLPEFNAFVGNFPYIRQELIEKKDKGFKEELTKLLAEEYFLSYPKLFETKGINGSFIEHLKSETPEKQKKLIHRNITDGKISLCLSGQADIYTYIFIHTATLLAKNGSFAIITSNSWLDVAYGAVLKQFLLDHFQIRMIVASWAEPWFEDAAVNTIITVLDKKDSTSKENEGVKFVKLKKKFTELIPYHDLQIESVKRWQCIDTIVRTIEGAQNNKHCRKITDIIAELDTDDMRIRIIPQNELRKEVYEKGDMSKWGKYLRAPDVYFEILDKCKDKLVPLKQIANVRRGYTTGINEFFYLEPVEIIEERNQVKEPNEKYLHKGVTVLCRNTRGWEGPIESKYLKKIIKSPKESQAIIIDPEKLKYFIFVCNKSKAELKKSGDVHALKYIEWGEKQKTEDGMNWKEVPSVTGRMYWYSISENEPGYILLQMINNDRFVAFLNENKVLVDHNLFEFLIEDKKMIDTAEKYLNSYLFALIKEVNSRVNLGDGATKTEGIDWKNLMLIPNKELKIKFNVTKFFKRKVLPVFEEVKQKDRKELDTAVLEALGLDAKEYLPRIYDGLCEMVQERLELPKMRKKQRKATEQFAYEEVKQSVIHEITPNGVRQFPKAFYTGELNYEKLKFETFNTTGLELVIESFFSQVEVKDANGKNIFTTDSPPKAQFAIVISKHDNHQLRIPSDERICENILREYNQYKEQLKNSLEANARQKLHDWNLAEKMAKDIMSEFGL